LETHGSQCAARIRARLHSQGVTCHTHVTRLCRPWCYIVKCLLPQTTPSADSLGPCTVAVIQRAAPSLDGRRKSVSPSAILARCLIQPRSAIPLHAGTSVAGPKWPRTGLNRGAASPAGREALGSALLAEARPPTAPNHVVTSTTQTPWSRHACTCRAPAGLQVAEAMGRTGCPPLLGTVLGFFY
jgi:hypothetical protein